MRLIVNFGSEIRLIRNGGEHESVELFLPEESTKSIDSHLVVERCLTPARSLGFKSLDLDFRQSKFRPLTSLEILLHHNKIQRRCDIQTRDRNASHQRVHLRVL